MSSSGTNLGGKVQGLSANNTTFSVNGGERSNIRNQLRRSWNTAYATGEFKNNKRVITPFRAVNNSGDFLSRRNYVCGGPNPSHRTPGGIRASFGSIISQCDNTGVPASSTNVKYVPDSSEYILYKKQVAMNKTYNDTKR